MKRLFVNVILLYLFSLNILGQQTKNVAITFNYNDFQLTTNNGLLNIASANQWISLDDDTLAPALPYVSVNVLVGSADTLSSMSFTKNETLVRSNVTIAPNPTPIPSNMPYTPQPSQNIVYSNPVYPATAVQNMGVDVMDGYHMVALKVCPFRYDAVNKKLYFINSLNVNLGLTTGNIQGFSGNNMREIVKSLVINPGEMDSLYSQATSEARARIYTAPPQTNYEYIIVTRDSLKSAFQKLADWKTMKGIRGKVLTIEEIEQNYTARNLPLKIKYALKDYYNGTHQGLKYVLLGGDVDIVPTQGCYGKVRMGTTDKIDYNIPTDLFYASFIKMDWDSNGDSIYATHRDLLNFSQDIVVTRLPVRAISEIQNLNSRILLYEKGLNTNDDDYKRILMCGAEIVHHPELLQSDVQIYGNMIYNQSILPYWDGERFFFYDTYKDVFQDAYSAENLNEELSTGYPFVYVDSHGDETSFSMEMFYDSYGVTDALSLNNSLSTEYNGMGTTNIITSACLTSAFDLENTCLGEAFLRNPYSGVLTYVGCSREGWGHSDVTKLDPSGQYSSKLLEILFKEKTARFGDAVCKTKASFLTDSRIYNQYRWLQFGINPFGDPEMPVFTEAPNTFQNVVVAYQNDTLFITTGVDSCTICITDRATAGNIYYNVVLNSSSAAFILPQNTYNICINKLGYSPHLEIFSNETYIQNETFDENTTISAYNVNMGSDVTTTKPSGSVTIESGETTIKSTNTVIIKNDFKVQNGAEFKIITGN